MIRLLVSTHVRLIYIVAADFVAACGGKVINLEKYFCCGDKAYLIEENKKCCAGVVMDRQFYGCTLSFTGYVKFPNCE